SRGPSQDKFTFAGRPSGLRGDLPGALPAVRAHRLELPVRGPGPPGGFHIVGKGSHVLIAVIAQPCAPRVVRPRWLGGNHAIVRLQRVARGVGEIEFIDAFANPEPPTGGD